MRRDRPMKRLLRKTLAGIVGSLSLCLGLGALPASAGTLEDVRARGMLNCGVSTGLFGFSERDTQGAWSGFDVDFCKALAAAVLNDPAKVTYVPLPANERFAALRDKKIDLLSRNSTWTLEREAGLGLLFAGIVYHDGQGIMVMRKPGITSALELTGTNICVQDGTTSRRNLADFFRNNSMTYTEKVFPTSAEVLKGLESGACDAMTTDQSALYAERLKLVKPSEATILPDVLSKEPLAPVVRADDIAWYNIARWTRHVLINAEELGVSSTTLREALNSKNPDVRSLIGAEGGLGKMLGLDDAWVVRVITATGNYGEMFERHLGVRSRLGIPRGLNLLWLNGGILYAPPLN